jgi:hypothetical protein
MALNLQRTDHWLHYFIARIDCALDDRLLSDRGFREWMDEALANLAAFAHEAHPIPDALQREAAAAAQAEHQEFFHPPEDDAE